MTSDVPGYAWAAEGCFGYARTIREALTEITGVVGSPVGLSPVGWTPGQHPWEDKDVADVVDQRGHRRGNLMRNRVPQVEEVA